MSEYHKIQSVYLRDPATKHATFLDGQWSLPEFGYLASNQWSWTEKVDGMNIRVGWNGVAVSFGGKSDVAQIHPQLRAHLESAFAPDRLRACFPDVTTDAPFILYGEGYGAGIQKGGGDYRQDKGFILFDVLAGALFLQRADVEDVALKLECNIVPIIGHGTLGEAIECCKALPRSVVASDRRGAEGLVMRPLTELRTRRGDRLITKVKVKDFR